MRDASFLIVNEVIEPSNFKHLNKKNMPIYHKLGNIPPKRHTQFRKPNGDLYYEQLFGTVGFDGMSTNSYHEQRPTQVKEIRTQYSVAPKSQNQITSNRINYKDLMWHLKTIILKVEPLC